jgi:hypothetical protein
MFIFNFLIPAVPLNGARIFSDLLMLCKVPIDTIAVIIMVLSGIIAICCIISTIVGRYFDLFGIFIALYICWCTFELFQQKRANKLQESYLFRHAPAHAGAGQAATSQKPVIGLV